MASRSHAVPKPKPKIVISSDTATFDEAILENWCDEGYKVTYLQYDPNHKQRLDATLLQVADELDEGEVYAIIAYGPAADHILITAHNLTSKLSTLVAFYPTYAPPAERLPDTFHVQVHYAGSTNAGPGYVTWYNYPDTSPGFAEPGKETYDRLSTNVAWSRVLSTIRRTFSLSLDAELERIWEGHLALEFATRDADATMATMVPEPYVNHIPTVTGGIGHKELHRFYAEFFIPNNPPSTRMRLVSRTVGADRIVDELYFCFDHTCEMHWILPGVPPTGRFVEVILLTVVCIRGGKLYHEHIYWDQASVLVQVGLLDPKLGAVGLGKGGVERLPIVGGEAARKVLDEKSVPSNELIPVTGW